MRSNRSHGDIFMKRLNSPGGRQADWAIWSNIPGMSKTFERHDVMRTMAGDYQSALGHKLLVSLSFGTKYFIIWSQ